MIRIWLKQPFVKCLLLMKMLLEEFQVYSRGSGKAISVRGMLDLAREKNIKLYGIPYFRLLKQFSEQMGDQTLSKRTRTVNVMALSASMAILNFDKHILSESIRYIFRTKPKIAENNVSIRRLCI